MKKLIFTLAAGLTVFTVFSQNTGTVHYTETRKLHFNIEGGTLPPGMPEEDNNKTILFFTDEASLYMNDTAQAESMNHDEETEDGGRIHIMMDRPDTRIYCDLINKKITSQEDFMQRKFLVEKDMQSTGWKLTGKQKMILNYSCMEAVKTDSMQTTTVWFTSQIPVASGPAIYTGLPGLVLEINSNDGDQLITATDISDKTDVTYIKKPKEGKKLSEEEFDKIVADKMKEMGVDESHGDNIIIRINDN